MPRPRTQLERSPRGFTLMELLLSVSLTALLMVALMDSFQGFGHQLTSLRESEAELEAEDCLVQICHDVRHAWLVDELVADELAITDAYGSVTGYAEDGGDLEVTRPSGATGTVLTDVQTFDVRASLFQRLREDAPVDSYETWWSDSQVVGGARAILVEEGLPLALGFTLGSDAPSSFDTVTGVEEQIVVAELTRLLLPVAFALPVTEDTSVPANPQIPGSGKVDVCHIPPGNPDNANVLSISVNAVDAHLAHGDTLGTCPPPPNQPAPQSSKLIIELHEARAPQDARPYGPPLADISVPVMSLPGGTFAWTTLGAVGAGYTVMCHIPPGSAEELRTLAVPDEAVTDHINHGDVVGSCVDGDATALTPVCVYTAPVVDVPLDLAPMAMVIEPGRAYTLVLRIDGRGTLLFTGAPLGSDILTGVAHRTWSGGNYIHKAYALNRIIDGIATITQTVAHDVISTVSLDVEMVDGNTLTGSASVLGQVAVPNPWLGAVPGELPVLELSGQ